MYYNLYIFFNLEYYIFGFNKLKKFKIYYNIKLKSLFIIFSNIKNLITNKNKQIIF